MGLAVVESPTVPHALPDSAIRREFHDSVVLKRKHRWGANTVEDKYLRKAWSSGLRLSTSCLRKKGPEARLLRASATVRMQS